MSAGLVNVDTGEWIWPNHLSLAAEFIGSSSLCTKTFESFGMLPKELRLQIWRESFPPSRRYSIDDMGNIGHPLKHHLDHSLPSSLHVRIVNKTLYCSRNTPSQENMSFSMFLANLNCVQINRESREETLRHYRLIWFDEKTRTMDWQIHMTRENQKSALIAFNPRRDIAFLPLKSVWGFCDMRDHRGNSWVYIPPFPAKHPQIIQSIEVLDIGVTSEPYRSYMDLAKENVTKFFIRNILERFTSLVEIRGCSDFVSSVGEPIPNEYHGEAQVLMEEIAKCIDIHKERHPAYKVPKLSLVVERNRYIAFEQVEWNRDGRLELKARIAR
jgi:hypothetical protein